MAETGTEKTHLRWQVRDEETADNISREPRALSRSNSNSSRISHVRKTIEPAVALPIQYRTVSIEIESPDEKRVAVERTKKVAIELGNVEWHILTPQEVEKKSGVDPSVGLSSDEVQRRLQKYGKNQMSPIPTPWFWTIFGYFFRGFGSLLLTASILVFICWKPLGEPDPAVANLALAIVLLAVFFIQAAFNAFQDWSSSRVMASITAMLPENCLLLRNGAHYTTEAKDIVPGDVIFLKAGNKLPADVRFIEVSGDANFDRSILTGESFPISATVDSTDDNYLETHCIGLQGTHCVAGTAIGIVVSTGDSTVFGQIAKLTGGPKTGLTTLEIEVLRFVAIITSLIFSMIILVCIVWATFLRHHHPDWINVPTLIVDCVSVATAFIPEGLPIALTMSLTITANIMRKNKILCKSLKTVETLGAVSVICSDKTGTLTRNKMFVTDSAIFTSTFASEEARDEMVTKGKASGIHQLRAMTGLCNASEFDAATMSLPIHERTVFGDATDQAILRFSESLGSVSDLRRMWKKTCEVAFNSKNKFMIRTFTSPEPQGLDLALSPSEASQFASNDVLVTIKGAPDILIERCGSIIDREGNVQALNAHTLDTVKELKDRWSSEGKRVILLARKVVQAKDLSSHPTSTAYESEVIRHVRTGLILVGLVGIVDPPREEIPEVVKTLRRAGIRMFMVTGDFGLTALAIARQCGIVTVNGNADDVRALERSDSSSEKSTGSGSAIVISGSDLMTLNDHQWEQLCKYPEIVFARTTPDQKLRIVREFQARNEIVAMTGDGVNDAPSLRAADIGIALGSGSDIAIEAADMVLLDSFSGVVEAVKYGRVVFDNLKKTCAYLLPAGSFSEFWPVFTNVVFGIPQVLSSFLMIIICCFTDCAAASVLAYEAAEADVLLRPPRNPKKDRLVNWRLFLQAYGFIGILECFSSFAMAFWYLQRKGLPFSVFWFRFGFVPDNISSADFNARLNEASSIYFINLIVMQWFNLMAARTRRLSIFQHPPAFNKATQNLYLFPAIAFSLCMGFLWLYIPELQAIIGTANVPAENFFLPAAFGLGVLFLDEGRKAAVRRWPNGFLARIAW